MNVEWLARLPAPLRRALYFGLQSAIGSRVWSAWREFLAWERLTPDQLNQAVEQKLDLVLTTAAKNSEYYRNLSLFRRSGESVQSWLRRFPTLSRTKLREHFSRLVSDTLRGEITSPESVSRRHYDWLIVKTGGTTGVPTTVAHDANARDWGRATRLYAARLCGFPFGTPYFRLWGSEQDLLGEQASIQQCILRGLLAEVPMNAFRSREVELRQHLDTIHAHPQIQHLMTYVDAAVSLATFIHDQNISPPSFKTIMACAGTVTPEFRRILETTFAAEVFDKFGSRECCDMACECSQHTGLHVFSPNVFLEIVDENGVECPPGKPGRILVTMLNNPGFPMIRYEVGDLGVWATPTPCPCGSPFPRLESLQGRQDDMLLTEDGTLQSSSFVRHFVGVSLNRQLIRDWQFEQTGRARFIFRYVAVKSEGLDENLHKLKESFQLVFGRSAEFEMQPVNAIPTTASGKMRWVINSYRKP
ncbi:MAG: phenylacetate--CoA ligase family protein [Verrucomicrobia bacterium]|nr:phenylacetate--CoA ligase family protein [Verrucomicrobiota bacterium]